MLLASAHRFMVSKQDRGHHKPRLPLAPVATSQIKGPANFHDWLCQPPSAREVPSCSWFFVAHHPTQLLVIVVFGPGKSILSKKR